MSYPLPVVIEKDGSNEKAYDLYSRLLKDRIIFVGTPIDDQVANAIIAQLLFPGWQNLSNCIAVINIRRRAFEAHSYDR